MADDKNKQKPPTEPDGEDKTRNPGDDAASGEGAGGTGPGNAIADREKDVLIGRLQAENKALRDEIDAYKALESERSAAVARAKATRSASKPVIAVALMPLIGEGRREIMPARFGTDGEPLPADQLTESECKGLTEGVHYARVALDAA